MKKTKIILLIWLLMMLVLCTGCGNSADAKEEKKDIEIENTVQDGLANSEAEQETNEDVGEAQEKPAIEEPAEQSGNTIIDNRNRSTEESAADQTAQTIPNPVIEVTDADFGFKEYKYENSFGDTIWFVIITNNSEATVKIKGNAIARDKDGNAVGAASLTVDVLGPQESTIEYYYFDSVLGINSVETKYSYDTSPNWTPVISILSVEQTLNDKNLTIKVKNNGSICAQFVKAYALFMDKNDNIIHYDSTYITDSDSEIKPGTTLSAQLNSRKTYDHVLLYFTGRSDGKEYQAGTTIDPSLFELTEYTYESAYGDTYYFIAIKNNSEYTVEVGGNATAKDANGNIIGADDFDEIDVLAPGEESIGYFYFDDVIGIAEVEYDMRYTLETHYRPVLSALSSEISLNNKNAIILTTNNGDYSAQFVKVYVLFLDSKNNVVAWDYGYITDDDSEIKPGDTLSRQLNTRKAFDHIAVYFTGRG